MSENDTRYCPRVLVVDDVPANVKMLCTALATDYEVRFATSGPQALELIEQSKPDLILLDVMMPGMSGHEVHQRLRERAELRTIPVMFVTADDSPESELEGLRHGADDYVTKPFVIPIVLARVRNLLQRSRLQRELELSLLGANQGLWEWEVTGADVFFNANWAIPLGYAAGEMQPCVMPWEHVVHPADWSVLRASRDAYLAGQTEAFDPELRMRHKNDSFVWMQLHGSTVERDRDGQARRMMGTYMVISRRKEAEQALRENEQRLATVIASMQDAVMVLDVEGCVTLFHAPADSPLHELAGLMLGRDYHAVLPEPMALLLDALPPASQRQRRPMRHELTLELHAQVLHLQVSVSQLATADEEPTGLLVVVQDVTARKRAEEEIRALAFYDPLTRLPNRRLLRDRLRHAMNSSARSRSYGALMLIDLDDFKKLNDTLGHDAGDRLLVDIAQRLTQGVRGSDTLARVGGDEFVLLLEDLGLHMAEAALSAQRIGEKVLRALQEACDPVHGERGISASIGASLFLGNEQNEEQLIKQADLAMYSAKADGRATLRFFDPLMEQRVTEHVDMERALHRSLQAGDFFLLYHPQVDRAGRIVGVEALARWNHPERGILSPSQFIPVAEETGLIVPLGSFILDAACSQLARWQAQEVTAGLSMAINISALQFQRADFVERVASAIQRCNVDARRLKLEITESVLLTDVETVVQRMLQLSALGVRISLDDFGTGYSSLSYLKQLPLHELKIDQSFVRSAPNNEVDVAIVRAISTLGRSLGLVVVAEGVECESEWRLLLGEDCHEFQGFYFSLPVLPAQIDALAAAGALPAASLH